MTSFEKESGRGVELRGGTRRVKRGDMGELETGERDVVQEVREKGRTKEVRRSLVRRRRGRGRMWDGRGESAGATQQRRRQGSRSCMASTTMVPMSSRTTPTSQHNTSQLSQSMSRPPSWTSVRPVGNHSPPIRRPIPSRGVLRGS